MSQISMLRPQSSDGREALVACSEKDTKKQSNTRFKIMAITCILYVAIM